MFCITGKSSAAGSSPGHPLLLESGDSLHARASLRRSERTLQVKPAGFIEVDGVRSVGRAWRAVLLLALVTLTLEWASASTWLGPWVPLFKGVDHAIGTNSPGGGGYPVVQRVHALRVDLSDPDVALFASPRSATYVPGVDETDGMTVSTFVATHHLQVAINANEFSPTNYYLPAGTAMNVHGWLVCTGQVVSVQDSADNAAAIFFDATNGASIIHTNWPATSPAGVFTAVSGT